MEESEVFNYSPGENVHWVSLSCGSTPTIKGKQRLSLLVGQKEIEYQIDVEYDIKNKFALSTAV